MVELSGAGNAESGRNLPVLIGQVGERRQHGQQRVRSDFASQLIAARDHMPVQRARRRVEDDTAAHAYGRTARLGERRVPAGYRLSVSA